MLDIKCNICNKLFKNLRSLRGHISNSKSCKMSTEEYYLKYIGSKTVCLNCESPTKFKDLKNGYYQYCSISCVNKSDIHKEKCKNTNIKKYGAEYISQVKHIRQKAENTMLEKYGGKYAFSSDVLKNKINTTMLKKYKTLNASNIKIFQDKKIKSYLNKYGVNNPLKSEIIKNKVKETNLNKYGNKCIFKSEIIKEKIKQSNLKKYGFENPAKSELIKTKIKITNNERYGCDFGLSNSIIREKIKNTCILKYKVNSTLAYDEFIKKRLKTSKEIYYNKLLNSDRLKNKVIPEFDINIYNGVDSKNKYKWKCVNCNDIFIDNIDDGRIPRCLKCYPINNTSNLELEVFEFIKSLNVSVENSNRTIISPYELDIYIPVHNIAIEFNGLYWHSEYNGKDENYHLNKTKLCNDKQIKLIHIFEDEWINKPEIVKSILKSKLRLISNKIYARNCKILKLSNEDAINFLNDNHLDGFIDGIHYGLSYNSEIVSILTVSKLYDSQYDYEILRFCNKLDTIVIGGFGKLLKHFKSIYIDSSIISSVNLRYFNGNLHEKYKFKKIKQSNPSYYFMNNYKSRISTNMIEIQNLDDIAIKKFDRIFDCGNLIYVLK